MLGLMHNADVGAGDKDNRDIRERVVDGHRRLIGSARLRTPYLEEENV